MSKELTSNGLRLVNVKTQAIKLTPEGNILTFLNEHFKEDGFIIAYLDYAVLMGYYRNGKYIFYNHGEIEEKYLQRLRLFNKSKELYIWRSSGSFKARLRIDDEGEDAHVVDACQVLWGTMAKPLGEFTELTEDRGTTLIVPLKNVTVNDRKNRLGLITRNYIGYTPAFQATYIDCRFVDFCKTLDWKA